MHVQHACVSRADGCACMQLERGTAARAWGHAMALVAAVTATAATLPIATFIIRTYVAVLRISRRYIDNTRFQLQSRLLLVHSADQVYRAARLVFGDEVTGNIRVRLVSLHRGFCDANVRAHLHSLPLPAAE
jgi:hypothetical protein